MIDKEACLAQARALVQQIEAGNEDEVNRLLNELARSREMSLFQEIGRLTREFHEALNSFRLDTRISEFINNELPNTKSRLRYIIEMTERSAHRTIDVVEDTIPLSIDIEQRAQELQREWERFQGLKMSVEEIKQFSKEIHQFLGFVHDKASLIHSKLAEVLLNQDFQDLTGQLINRVILVVERMEESLVNLLASTGQNVPDAMRAKDSGTDPRGLHGPRVDGLDNGMVKDQDEVDDLLSSMGF